MGIALVGIIMNWNLICSDVFQIDRATLERTINSINEIYLEAESLSGRTYCESCFACLTAYLAYLCMDTYYEKVLDLLQLTMMKVMEHEKSQRESSFRFKFIL